MPKPQSKRCSKCKNVLPVSDFHKDICQADGLSRRCKECRKVVGGRKEIPMATEQINSAVRAMAEAQAAINHEKAKYDQNTRTLQKHLQEAIETWQGSLATMQVMIENYVNNKCKGRIPEEINRSPFGTITKESGKVVITLNTELAAKRMGKP